MPIDPNKHGLIEFYEMKYRMMSLLQNDVADQMGIPNEVKRELVDKAGSWRLFREHVEPYDGRVVVCRGSEDGPTALIFISCCTCRCASRKTTTAR